MKFHDISCLIVVGCQKQALRQKALVWCRNRQVLPVQPQGPVPPVQLRAPVLPALQMWYPALWVQSNRHRCRIRPDLPSQRIQLSKPLIVSY
jgi:hypothetical protein